MQLCIFEDACFNRLEPLIYHRPTYDLICGINSLRTKILHAYPDIRYTLHCRTYLGPLIKTKNPTIAVNKIDDDECLFINGRILAPRNMMDIIPIADKQDKLYLNKETIIAARVSGKRLRDLKNNLTGLFSLSDFDGIPVEQVEIRYIDYIWDITNNNIEQLKHDFQFLKNKKENIILGKVHPGAHLVESDNIFIAEGAEIKPGAVLDASLGPIYIDKNATVFANSVVEDTVYLGEYSQIRSCAQVYHGVSIGKMCKVGGEVEDTVILSYSNKQHSGFLGHAYLGSWVNIGADTNCSDLKNNYGFVKVYVNGEIVDSGVQFLGVIMGDHSKTAINTMFNTGTIAGYSCNIFGAGFPDKYLPSFSWGGADTVTTYDIQKSIETAEKVMLRRNYIMTDLDKNLFKKIFNLTAKEREKRGYPY
ncbi:MAG: putative sugar nucleotidyl transferase [Ignavibacteria bacterium]